MEHTYTLLCFISRLWYQVCTILHRRNKKTLATMDEDESHEEVQDNVIDEYEKVMDENVEKIKSLKKRIMSLLVNQPNFDFDSENTTLKKLDKKSVEELEALVCEMEIVGDSSHVFQKSRAVLRVFTQIMSWFSVSLSYERLSNKMALLKYLDGKLPAILSVYGDEFDVFAILVEEFERSYSEDDEKKKQGYEEEARVRRGEPAKEPQEEENK